MALFDVFRTTPTPASLRSGMRSTGSSVNYLCLLAALEAGWRIQSASVVSGRGSKGAGKFYSLRLTHPSRNQDSEMTVEKSGSAEALLRQQGIPL